MSLRVERSKAELAAALEAWFKSEIDRVWRHYQTGAYVARIVPTNATVEKARQIKIATVQGDAGNQLERLQEEYRSGDYDSATSTARTIVEQLGSPFDEGDQRFTILKKQIVEALCGLEEARLQWSLGNEDYWPLAKSVESPVAALVASDPADTPTLREIADAYL